MDSRRAKLRVAATQIQASHWQTDIETASYQPPTRRLRMDANNLDDGGASRLPFKNAFPLARPSSHHRCRSRGTEQPEKGLVSLAHSNDTGTGVVGVDDGDGVQFVCVHTAS